MRDAIVKTFHAAVDLLGDGLDIALVSEAIEVVRVPIPKRHESFPWVGIDEIRIGYEVRRIETFPVAPIVECLVVCLAGDLHAGSAHILLAVAVGSRRVAEIGARVVTGLHRRVGPQISRS
ncbi:hypothetical protein J2W42_005876 [Rhizobium tibeticum]|uniref:hypothetical protein n=1 Tax=Rhizobium tibeticum TaxID=501024 RepID=UPI0027894C09|nr:hypothetical protein [Rhizobium tibeticum]